MQATANHLRETIAEAMNFLEKISEEEATLKPQLNKWSKKEIIGHLIDSASNNHQKFVRTMAVTHLEFVGYAQEFWVESQVYNSTKWHDLLVFWRTYNFHLANVIENVIVDRLQNTITLEGYGPFTLEFVMKDYVEHVKHHLLQILPESKFLETKFSNIYNA